MEGIELPDYLFPSPCTISVAGPSGSAKSSICMEILRYRQTLFSQPVAGVLYCYSEWQPMFRNPPGGDVHFHQGLPTIEELDKYLDTFKQRHFLLFLDDLMSEVSQSQLMQDIFTKISHHRNFSCINILQNLFTQGKAARSQSLNSHFYILTRTCRDIKQIALLGSQLFPGKTKEFVKVYQDAVDHLLNDKIAPFLLVSCHPLQTKRSCQLLANVLPPDAARVLYRLD